MVLRDWYHLRMGSPRDNNRKSYEFGIIVNRAHVDSVKDKITGSFEEDFQKTIGEFRESLPFNYFFEARLLEDNFPWLFGFNTRHGTLALDRESLDSIDYNLASEALYFSHNCDNFTDRGLLVSAFDVWAHFIDGLHLRE